MQGDVFLGATYTNLAPQPFWAHQTFAVQSHSVPDRYLHKKPNVAPLSLSNHSCFTQVYVRYDNLKIGKQKEQTLLSGDLSEDIVMDGD